MDNTDSIDEAPELAPIELPKRSISPSLEERIQRVESILNVE